MGAYREIACRDLLRQLEARGLITLPPPLKAARQPGYRNRTSLCHPLDTTLLEGRLDHFPTPTLTLVSRTPNEQLYNGLIGAHHFKHVYLYPLTKNFRERCQTR